MKEQSKAKLIFIITCIFTSLFVSAEQLAASQKALIYEYYTEEQSGEVIERQYVEIEDLPSGQKAFKRKIKSDNYTCDEQFVLDANYETQTWKVNCLGDGTGYVGERRDNILFIKGRFRERDINRKIELDNKPFYCTPKFNLSKFALSDSKQIKFWMLRKDKLTKTLMQAKKIGEETIIINGKEVNIIKVYCSATGVGEKFYKRTYFFRKSDGLFVKKENPDGKNSSAILISEQ